MMMMTMMRMRKIDNIMIMMMMAVMMMMMNMIMAMLIFMMMIFLMMRMIIMIMMVMMMMMMMMVMMIMMMVIMMMMRVPTCKNIVEIFKLFNRHGVARAELQRPLSLIKLLSHHLWKYLQETLMSKPEEQGSWHFERRFTSPHLLGVTCHMSHVMCHMSRVTCHMYFFLFFLQVLKLIGVGSSIKEAYPV